VVHALQGRELCDDFVTFLSIEARRYPVSVGEAAQVKSVVNSISATAPPDASHHRMITRDAGVTREDYQPCKSHH